MSDFSHLCPRATHDFNRCRKGARDRVHLCHLTWTGHHLLQSERGFCTQEETWSGIATFCSMKNVFKFLIFSKVCHSVTISMDFISPSGYSLWLQVICLTFWRHWPQHVPCWQRGVQLICTRSGFHHQRNLPVPGRARNLPLLSHRYITSLSESFSYCIVSCIYYWFLFCLEIQSTVEHSATQMSPSPPTSTQ